MSKTDSRAPSEATGAVFRGKLPDPAPKWQKHWEEIGLFRAPEMPDPEKPKYFVMPMFAYPSGDIHMGHSRNYTMTDAIARKKMMEGFQVLHAFGWDAFGLPAEQAAIQRGLPPQEWTLANIAQSKATLQKIGISFDWTREVASCLPDYYRWSQWMFVQFYKRGLAYRKESEVNWCESCRTVLANEQAAGGVCWRCDNPVGKKTLTQWYLKITDYADRLLDDIDTLDGWPENLKALQRNWIGRSHGVEVDFRLADGTRVPIFTTRPDTIYGVTFMAIASDAPLMKTLAIPSENREAVDRFVETVRAQSSVERLATTERKGVDTGVKVTNPLSGDTVPLWVGDYVLAGYGTGCIMGVPAHDQRDFEFARKYDLPIKPVIRTGDTLPLPGEMDAAVTNLGIMADSGPFDGLEWQAGIDAVIAHVEAEGIGRAQTEYHLTDWLISRQRYWGAPIPMIHCGACGIVPVPEEDLPVLLPKGDINYLSPGRSPLADIPEFMNVTCPQCGGAAQRDPDTMDTFICSSWYFLRYLDPQNDRAPFEPRKAAAWLPIDCYMGGITHATGHLIYFRFFTKFLKDIGRLTIDEPAVRMFNHGMVMDSEGAVMSKSAGNVVSPVDLMAQYGVDPVRLTMFFAAPGDREMLWNESGLVGAERFLCKLDRFVRETRASAGERAAAPGACFDPAVLTPSERDTYRKLHETIRKIDRDFDLMQFNTHTAAVMELLGVVSPGDALRADLRFVCAATMVQLLAPLVPHLAEEWWEVLGFATTVFRSRWPQVDERALPADRMTIAVQVNGRLRGRVTVPADADEAAVVAAAEADAKVQPHLGGERIKQIYVTGRLLNLVVKPR